MKLSVYKSYDDLPLFLNTKMAVLERKECASGC